MPISESNAADLYRNLGKEPPAELAGAKASKYRNVKKEVDGIVFDSALEARAWRILKLWEHAGAISCLRRQVRFRLQSWFRDPKTGKLHRAVYYVPDFMFYDYREQLDRIIDVKGYQTEVFRLKAKLFAARYPLLTLELWDKAMIRDMERGR